VTVDWGRLSARTKGFGVLEAPVDPAGNVADVVAVGLCLKLSELTARFPSTGGNSLTVYADTFVVDTAVLAVKSLVVVARSVDTTALKGVALRAPATAAEFLVGKGALTLANETATATIVTGFDPLTATTITGPTLATTTATDDRSIGDLTGRPYALNALRASFAAATWLLDSPSQADQATARDMLAWVAVATGPAAATTATSPTEWSDLHHVATPLLLAANVVPGATYVPALSTTFYDTQISKLLDTLDAYDRQLNTLTTATNLGQTLAAVADTLTDTAATELGPLQTQLDTLTRNINDLNVGINTLNYQFAQQTSTIDTAWADLKVALTDKQISDWFNACIDMALSAIKIGFDAAKFVATGGADLSALKGVITESVGVTQKAYATIVAIAKDVTTTGAPLVKSAGEIIKMQDQLLHAYVAAQSGEAAAAVSDKPALFAIDPALAWDNWLAEVDRSLSAQTVPAAGKFLVCFTVLANIGKAMSSKVAMACQQLSQRRVVRSQYEAATSVTARWKELAAKATTDEEKAAALSGLIAAKRDGISRTLFVAWTNYVGAYRFVTLKAPAIKVDLDMSTAQLRNAFSSVSTWVGRLLGDGEQIQLPGSNVDLDFQFPIALAGTDAATTAGAVLTPAAGKAPATITWTIPPTTTQLDGVLPADVAIWITSATFTLDGVKANHLGNVITKVSTSGIYQNPDRKAHRATFVSRSIVGNFAYAVGPPQRPTSPWTIPTDLTMTPTPFTQWTMTFDPDGGDPSAATELHMHLRVNYQPVSTS
jgi:hypothetical protein